MSNPYRHVEIRLRALRRMFDGNQAKLCASVQIQREDGLTELLWSADPDGPPATFVVPDALLPVTEGTAGEDTE